MISPPLRGARADRRCRRPQPMVEASRRNVIFVKDRAGPARLSLLGRFSRENKMKFGVVAIAAALSACGEGGGQAKGGHRTEKWGWGGISMGLVYVHTPRGGGEINGERG